jgi:hypothetical protein
MKSRSFEFDQEFGAVLREAVAVQTVVCLSIIWVISRHLVNPSLPNLTSSRHLCTHEQALSSVNDILPSSNRDHALKVVAFEGELLPNPPPPSSAWCTVDENRPDGRPEASTVSNQSKHTGSYKYSRRHLLRAVAACSDDTRKSYLSS